MSVANACVASCSVGLERHENRHLAFDLIRTRSSRLRLAVKRFSAIRSEIHSADSRFIEASLLRLLVRLFTKE